MSQAETPDPRRTAAHIGSRLGEVLGDRLAAAAVYGSAVMGDFLPGFSDLDIRIFTPAPLGFADCAAAHAALAAVPLGEVAYVQLSRQSSLDGEPGFIPGTYEWIFGSPLPPSRVELTEEQLRAESVDWLARAVTLLPQDALDWAAAVGRGQRQRRLLLTRLKPVVRAALVVRGEPAVPTWASGWPDLAAAWSRHQPELQRQLAALLLHLQAPATDADVAGEEALRLLYLLTS